MAPALAALVPAGFVGVQSRLRRPTLQNVPEAIVRNSQLKACSFRQRYHLASEPIVVARAGYVTGDVIAQENAHVLQTYGRVPIVMVRGKGSRLWDSDGKEYLDFMSGIAVNALGHSDPEWAAAVALQSSTLAHVSNIYYTPQQAELAERLTQKSFADRVFFCNTGAEANEAAIKFSRKFHYAQGSARKEFVSFSGSFHGRTMGSLALTSKSQYRTPFEPVMPGAVFGKFNDLDSARNLINEQTAAVIVEPMQGEGGIYAATPEFLQGLRALCDERGALLIFDEVQCGLGRTGTLWAHERASVTPDIMTVAKPLAGGLPIGATLVTQAVADSVQFGDHGSTFAGGPIVCAAALTVLDRIEAQGFLEHVGNMGKLLLDGLRDALGGCDHVVEVRGTGLLIGVQLSTKVAGKVVTACQVSGLLVISAGDGDVVRIVPPLVITKADIEEAIPILQKAVLEVEV